MIIVCRLVKDLVANGTREAEAVNIPAGSAGAFSIFSHPPLWFYWNGERCETTREAFLEATQIDPRWLNRLLPLSLASRPDDFSVKYSKAGTYRVPILEAEEGLRERLYGPPRIVRQLSEFEYEVLEDTYCYMNLVVLRGAPDQIHGFVEELNGEYPSVTEETPEETTRHIEWFGTTIGGLTSDAPNDNITTSYRFESEPFHNDYASPSLLFLSTLFHKWNGRLTVGVACFDNRPSFYAGFAMACTDTDRGIAAAPIDEAYFDAMNHFRGEDAPLERRITLIQQEPEEVN